MMEIYNEQVFDLFEDVPKRAERTKLKIYENKGMRSFKIKQSKTISLTFETYHNAILSVIYFALICYQVFLKVRIRNG